MIKIQAARGTLEGAGTEAVAYFIFQDKNLQKAQHRPLRSRWGVLPPPFATKAFTGKEGQSFVFYPPSAIPAQVIFVGLGALRELTLEKIRRGAAVALKASHTLHARSLGLLIPSEEILSRIPLAETKLSFAEIAMAMSEGVLLAAYRFDKFVTKKPPGVTLERAILLLDAPTHLRDVTVGIRRATIIAEAVYLARDLANGPGNEIYPESLAGKAREVGRRHRIAVKVLGEAKIRSLKMGGLLGVSQGSAKPPRFVIMEYRPKVQRSSSPTIVLVGKGVTFDAGGISIKPAANMAEMKMDMAGAAAVIGTLQAVAALGLPVNLVGLIPATENLPGGRALKPGDILRHLNGKTSEIDNTDAEGRLILADALSFASRFKPDLVIDLATLTGAVVVALGHHATGMLGTDRKAMDQLLAAGTHTHERVWELPMFEEYEKLIKSDIADVKNVGGRWAGAITGALFLKNFIGNYPWVHLDIAGTAILEEAQEYVPKGGSGVGVRLLTEFLSRWSKS